MKAEGSVQPTKRTRHYLLVVAFAVVVICGGVYGLYILSQSTAQTVSYQAEQSVTTTSNAYYRQVPTRLQIPSLTLDTTFEEPLGLNSDNTIEVPDSYTEVGWYKNGVTPGEVGPAVILGHVDSLDGPGVFYSLGKLKVGEDILVTRADNTVATFVVTELKRYPQSAFPTQLVYGATNESVLRLVTCSGTFDRGEQRYSHNLVVYATLK